MDERTRPKPPGCLLLIGGITLILVGIPMLICPGPGLACVAGGAGMCAAAFGVKPRRRGDDSVTSEPSESD